jgi:hypothetical protein
MVSERPVNLDALKTEIDAHPYSELIRHFAEIMQEIDDENGLGGGYGYYASLACACMDLFVAALRNTGWEDGGQVKQRQADRDRLLSEIAALAEQHREEICASEDEVRILLDEVERLRAGAP